MVWRREAYTIDVAVAVTLGLIYRSASVSRRLSAGDVQDVCKY